MSENGKTWALILAGLGVTALAAYEEAKNPSPNRGGPSTTEGTGSVLQQRPIPSWGSLTLAQQASYIRTMQQELRALGYGDSIPDNGDLSDPTTAAAVNRFLSDTANQAAANAYGVDTRATIYAIDDQARSNTGAPQASDYVAPPSSSGLSASGCPDGLCAVPSAPSGMPRGVTVLQKPRPAPARRVGFMPPGMSSMLGLPNGSGKT